MDKYGLTGKKLGHSFSGFIHGMLGDYQYDMYEKTEEEIKDFIKNGDYKGLNVTIPYKKVVMEVCTKISENAKKIGSINTIVKKDGEISGYNTDYYGFEYLIKNSGENIQRKKVIVLGNGGAAATVKVVLTDLMAAEIIVCSRKKTEGCITYEELDKYLNADYIVNTTPVGMYPDNGNSPIDISKFTNLKAVYDIIYNPTYTKILLDAKRLGIKAFNGLPMLVAQAKKASEIFRNVNIEDSIIDRITKEIMMDTMNITFIGMPGCGKTTVGNKLSEITGRPFVDVDEEIVKKTGKTIPDIFKELGEEGFRKIETEVFAEIASRSGQIIATGGGVVTRNENYDILRQHSIVIFLDRDINLLATDGRPLSKQRRLEDIYAERIDNYNSWCDYKIQAITLEQVIEEIEVLVNIHSYKFY